MRTALAILTAMAASALASSTCKQLPGKQSTGLAVRAPDASSEIPVGKPFTLTWDATGGGTVSILLLRGPSTNVLPAGCIVDSTPNTGTYTWTPPPTLENDKTHYGIQIIADGSGAFQYSTQFGISNPNPSGNDVTATTTVTDRHVIGTVYHTMSQIMTHPPSSPSPEPIQHAEHSANATTVVVAPMHKSKNTKLSTPAAGTGLANSSGVVKPTKSMSVPTTLEPLSTSAPSSTAPTSSVAASATPGAAVRVVGGGVLAGLGAVAAFVL